MNSTSPVQLCWFEEPEVKTSKMAEWHSVPKKVFLQCSLMIVQGILLFFEVLLNETSPVVIEMLKDKSFFQWGL